jgi:hypothetical protein
MRAPGFGTTSTGTPPRVRKTCTPASTRSARGRPACTAGACTVGSPARPASGRPRRRRAARANAAASAASGAASRGRYTTAPYASGRASGAPPRSPRRPSRRAALVVALAHAPVALRLPLGEPARLPLHRLEAAQPRAHDAPHALELVLARAAVAQRAPPRPTRRAPRRPGARRRPRGGRRTRPARSACVVRAHARRQRPLAHRAVQPRRAPRGEHRGGEVEPRRVGVVRARRAPAEGACACRTSPSSSR